MSRNDKRVKYGCYFGNMSMSVIGNLPPLLFLTFRTTYGISYSLLGLLILINFFTQLIVDLVFSFFSHKFNISKTVKMMPVLTIVGFLIFTLSPWLFPDSVYAGLAIGTVIFSASSGLAEVLISPVIAALPAEDPDREMSKLHSVYAWGVVGVVIISTVFLYIFSAQNWQWLAIIFMAVPLMSLLLLLGAKLPEIETPKRVSGAVQYLKNGGVWLCVFGIFLGGAAEVTMAQWSSSYLEYALGIPKVWGDVLGVAMFGVMLGFGRTMYSKIGKNIERVLLACGIGATLCYLVAAVSPVPVIGLVACAMTGLCTSMLWPGSLIVASGRFPAGGVFIYALMAAGGDMGASVAPQLVGVITDSAIANPWVMDIANTLGLHPEQLGMKLGMLVGMIFPLVSIPVFARIVRTKNK